jgi:hypothetical protein
MDKAQITVEFIIIMGLVSFIFLVTVNFIANEQKAVSQGLWAQDAQDRAESVAKAINSAYLAGDGASLNLTLPKRLVGGVNYTVTVRKRLVSVSVPSYGREFERKYLTADVEGAGAGLVLAPGALSVDNRNGTISLTEL